MNDLTDYVEIRNDYEKLFLMQLLKEFSSKVYVKMHKKSEYEDMAILDVVEDCELTWYKLSFQPEYTNFIKYLIEKRRN